MTKRPLLTHEEIWRMYDAVEQRLTASVSERMLELARLAPGMRVLNLATGRGEPAIAAAHRVGPTGVVLGVDRLLNALPDEIQQAWEADLVRDAEPLRKDGFVRLGGVTRIVVATSPK